jgi:hypothetical protein
MNSLFDSLPLGAAVLPLGVYLLALGWVHLRRRPLAIAGVWDGILLGASLVGLVTVGPIALGENLYFVTDEARLIAVR